MNELCFGCTVVLPGTVLKPGTGTATVKGTVKGSAYGIIMYQPVLIPYHNTGNKPTVAFHALAEIVGVWCMFKMSRRHPGVTYPPPPIFYLSLSAWPRPLSWWPCTRRARRSLSGTFPDAPVSIAGSAVRRRSAACTFGSATRARRQRWTRPGASSATVSGMLRASSRGGRSPARKRASRGGTRGTASSRSGMARAEPFAWILILELKYISTVPYSTIILYICTAVQYSTVYTVQYCTVYTVQADPIST